MMHNKYGKYKKNKKSIIIIMQSIITNYFLYCLSSTSCANLFNIPQNSFLFINIMANFGGCLIGGRTIQE